MLTSISGPQVKPKTSVLSVLGGGTSLGGTGALTQRCIRWWGRLAGRPCARGSLLVGLRSPNVVPGIYSGLVTCKSSTLWPITPTSWFLFRLKKPQIRARLSAQRVQALNPLLGGPKVSKGAPQDQLKQRKHYFNQARDTEH